MTVLVANPAAPVQAPGVALALLDAGASAALALVGVVLAGELERVGSIGVASLLVALPFTLAGPLGTGVERGRTGRVSFALAALVAIASSLGALAGVIATGLTPKPLVAVALGLPPLLFGVPLALFGKRLSRPDEPWRAVARLSPPDATPPFARTLAHGRLPLALRLILAPLAIATIPLAIGLLIAIRCYQLTLSRLMPPQCRFEPSCSRYGFEALRQFGLVRGLALTAFRVGRCQPFCTGGHDPLPAAPDANLGAGAVG